MRKVKSKVRTLITPHAGWKCSSCGKVLPAGVRVAKVGKTIICTECVQGGMK